MSLNAEWFEHIHLHTQGRVTFATCGEGIDLKFDLERQQIQLTIIKAKGLGPVLSFETPNPLAVIEMCRERSQVHRFDSLGISLYDKGYAVAPLPENKRWKRLYTEDSMLVLDRSEIESAKIVENRRRTSLGCAVVELYEYMNRLLDGEKVEVEKRVM
ncbi:hypothetical protein BDZ45DRAFT_740876 [Acephala macrosclerotiorum]|nr:hypothetical protein BDZ45DRAFT_740876 [Acephala macrosclerotiorum]